MKRLQRQIKGFLRSRSFAKRTSSENQKFAEERGALPAENMESARSFLRQFKPIKCRRELVRIGAPHDGGYLLPDDLDGIVAGFSPGVSDMSEFDLEIAERNIPVFMADASVDGIPNPHSMMKFDKLFLGRETKGNTISLEDWVAMYAPSDGDLVLQMDIEGAEFETILAAPLEILARFRIIVMEFHGFNGLFDANWLETAHKAVEKLNKQFDLVHLHANNYSTLGEYQSLQFPRVFEATYYRKDCNQGMQGEPILPHRLDTPCDPNSPDYSLPRFWA